MGKLAITGGTPVAQLETPAWPVFGDEERRRLLKVLESGSWSWMSEMETSFNEAFAAFHGAKHSLLVTNGTHALQLAYEALDVGWGDEVLVPGTTWQATAAAVLDVNAIPVLVDVDPETWCIDPKVAEAAITSRTGPSPSSISTAAWSTWTRSWTWQAATVSPLSRIARTSTAASGGARAWAPSATLAPSASSRARS